MDYYKLPQLSNSQLSELKDNKIKSDPSRAYQLGSAVDTRLTEDEDKFAICEAVEDNFLATYMAASFKDQYGYLLDVCEKQKIFLGEISFNNIGLDVKFETRCKADLYNKKLGCFDLKTTTAVSMKGFVNAVINFDYDRQAAFYLDTIKEVHEFYIIGISKIKPYKTFTLKIQRGDYNYRIGVEKYQNLMTLKYLLNNE